MRVNTFSDYPQWLSDMLFSDRHDIVAMAYRFPATIYFLDHIYLLHSAQDLHVALNVFQATMKRNGVIGAKTRVLNRPKWNARSFKVTVSQRFHIVGGDIDHRARMQFFVEWRMMRPAIRMVEVSQMPFADEIAAHMQLRPLQVG